MKEFHLQIVTPDGLSFDGKVESLLVRTSCGDVEILAGHADLFSSMAIGRVRIKNGEKTLFGSSSGGFVSVEAGEVKLICTTFEFKDDIDLARAKAAREKAEALLKNAKTDHEIDIAKAKLARAHSRINVASLK